LDDRQLYLLAVPAAGRKELTLDLSAPATAQMRLTDIGADFFGWPPDGRYIDWAIGSTFYRIRFSEELFEQNSAPRRVPRQFDHHRDARKRRSECL
jgi:hypothetical protein